MSGKRVLLVVIALALWLPLALAVLVPAQGDSEAADNLHARLEAEALLRVARLLTVAGVDRLPRDLSQMNASDLRGVAPNTALAISILELSAGDKAGAQSVLSLFEGQQSNPLARALERLAEGKDLSAQERAKALAYLSSFSNLSAQYYGYLLLADFPDDPASFMGEGKYKGWLAEGERDKLWLAAAALGIVGALLLGAYYLWRSGRDCWRRLQSGEEGEPLPWRWRPVLSLYLFVGLSWLAMVVALVTVTWMRTKGAPASLSLVLSQFLAYALCLLVLAWLWPKLVSPAGERKLTSDQVLGLEGFKLSYIGQGLGGYGVALVAAMGAGLITSSCLGEPVRSSNPLLLLLAGSDRWEFSLFVALVLLGPIYEEVLFRGLLFQGLGAHISPIGAAVVSSLIFALGHGDSHGLLVLTALGCVFCWLRRASGSLWPPIISHVLWNGGIVLYLLFIF